MSRTPLLWLAVWSVAFGVAEAAVVVYLRHIWYAGEPLDAPLFPLRVIDGALLRIELGREVATLLMLLGVACVAERRPLRRFAAFAFCFGAWDLVYYAALAVTTGFPATLMEWDVLFLVPRPWAAPVLAPVLVSLALVGGGALVLHGLREGRPSPLRPRDWGVLVAGGALILASFFRSAGAIEAGGMPAAYPWGLFLAGWAGGLGWFAWRWRLGNAPAPR